MLLSIALISTCLTSSLNDDEYSLLAIKALTTSASNGILAQNWSQGTSYCSWVGVTCGKKHPRVTALDLFNMDLQGTIAKEMGNLSFLTYLDVSNNSFYGQIPDEIGNLRRLRVLKMAFNHFNGRIPLSFGTLTNLERLNLSGNSFFGNVPWSIFNLSSLYEVDVYSNQLSGNLPPTLCQNSLKKLEILRLSYNQFGGHIPTSIGSCAQLKKLFLYSNSFTGSIPVEIGNLSKIQTLSLARNNLTGSIPSSISNLSDLVILVLKDNTIQGGLPSEIGRLSNLEVLELAQNRIDGELPHSVFNLSRLQTVSVGQNELSGNLPSFIDKGLPNLEQLFLSNNQLTGEIPTSISNLSRLNTLSLFNNSFTGKIPTNLGNLRLLKLLDVAANHFTNDLSIPEQDFLTSLTSCNQLSFIQFAVNPITGMLPKSIGSINLSASVDSFVAYSCKLKGSIPDEIGNLSSLIAFTVGFNELTGMIPEAIQRLSNMQAFEVYGNKLQGPIPHGFCNLKNLYLVTVWDNNLSGTLPTCLGTLPMLQIIEAENNSLNSHIPSTFFFNKVIRRIDLSNNFFDGQLPKEISSMESLRDLLLYGNKLSGMIPTTIGNLPSLSVLALSNNKFSGIIPDSFANLTALEYLDLSSNHLSGSIPKSLETLLYLDYFNVSFNELSGKIPDGGIFVNFTAESFKGNKDLCGAYRFLVKACKENITSMSSKNNKSLRYRYILPPIAFVVVAATTVLIFLACRTKKSSFSALTNLHLHLTHERISYYEIVRATSNFNDENIIGQGGYGLVYKGVFSDGRIYAIKVFNLDMHRALRSFETECRIIRSIRHRNLVKVITSYSNLDMKALVMAYMPNGNLDKWLYSHELPLSIYQRLQIMEDVAHAIDYLHQGYSSPITHCDLKPSNILLDEDMVAHVGDFGIAKFLTEDQRVAQTKTLGTIGYMAPEYGSSGIVSTMVDVYSYGILLMETFTRKKPTNEMFTGELSLTKWASESYPDAIMQIADATLLNVDEELIIARYKKWLKSIIGLSLECTRDIPEARPNMKDVLLRLKKIKAS
ncbi:uncharacterized protein [Henckelia pumila]|uniref:uncharacterized protein n=1 Tax=Henckelia pumila TaxID=405737 RepID=UPI003C6E7CAB